METLIYRIYTDESSYEELILDNFDYVLSLGLSKQKVGLTDFVYQLVLSVDESLNQDNAMLINQFIFNLSTKIKNESDVFKIEIIQNRENYIKQYIFNSGDFHNLNLMSTNDWLGNNTSISFIVDSMEQNYGVDA